MRHVAFVVFDLGADCQGRWRFAVDVQDGDLGAFVVTLMGQFASQSAASASDNHHFVLYMVAFGDFSASVGVKPEDWK